MSVHSTRSIRFGGRRGIHLRPAAAIAAIAQQFPCEIVIRCGERRADAKSVLDLLILAAAHGAELTLEATGAESDAALGALAAALTGWE